MNAPLDSAPVLRYVRWNELALLGGVGYIAVMAAILPLSVPYFVMSLYLMVVSPILIYAGVLARTERALTAPVDALRRRYGGDVVVEPASVRYAHGAPVLEPFMNVLVTGPARHLQYVQSDLGQRRGAMTRVDQRAGVFVIEAEAPLGHLLGYGDRLDERFDGSVEASLWLSRYCPIAGDGPYAA